MSQQLVMFLLTTSIQWSITALIVFRVESVAVSRIKNMCVRTDHLLREFS